MSIRYSILSSIIRLSGMKRIFRKDKEEILAFAAKLNRRRGYRGIPESKAAEYTDMVIAGRHVLKAVPGGRRSSRALLFLFGGGYLMDADAGDVKLAVEIAGASGRELWFPYYPLCTEASIETTFDMVFETYRRMLSEYKAEDIAFMGFSSGAALAIGICLHNNALGRPLEMPGLIIASSPGSVPISEEEKQKMAELSRKDIMLDSSFMVTIREIMECGREVPLYMLSGICGDFSAFPMTHFFYGSDEVLYAEAEFFEKAFRRYSASYELHVAEGMPHCYPAYTFIPEGRQAELEIIDLLRKQEG